MELSENEKRMLYQMEGCELENVIRDLRISAMYAPRLEQRKTAESVIRKLRAMPKEESRGLVMDIRRNYHVLGGAKTIGEMLAETRQKAAFGHRDREKLNMVVKGQSDEVGLFFVRFFSTDLYL